MNELKSLDHDELMNTSVYALPISARLKKCLSYDNLHTIGELLKDKTKIELLRIPKFGHLCLVELEYVLDLLSLKLKKSYWEE